MYRVPQYEPTANSQKSPPQLPNLHTLQDTADTLPQMLLVYPEHTVKSRVPTQVGITQYGETEHTWETTWNVYSSVNSTPCRHPSTQRDPLH